MTPSRWLLLGLMIFLSTSIPVHAQRRWQRLPAPRDPQFYEPRNKLENFEERYRTRGDFEAIVYRQISGAGASAAIEGGFFDRVRLLMAMEDLTKLRWFIAQAKDKLDEAK